MSQSFSLTRNKTQCPLLFRDGEPKGKETNNKKIKRDDDDDDDNVAIWRKRFQCQDRHNKSCLDSGKNL